MDPIRAARRESTDTTFEPGSFRDRHGRVFYHEGEVFRAVDAEALEQWEQVSASAFFARFRESSRLVETVRMSPDDGPTPPDGVGWKGVLRHARVPFISYPYEWCFGMLREAALLQLDLLLAALDEGFILKDSTPYNVQWAGTEPLFIDIASFERLAPGAPWVGYRQFCELYLYPLMLQAYKNVSFQPWLRGRLDGIPATQMRSMMSWRNLFRAGVLAHVVLQAKAEKHWAENSGRVRGELKGAGFHPGLIVANVQRLRRLVERLTWDAGATTWTEYATTHSYSEPGMQAKQDFVRSVAATRQRTLVWDIGANTGVFSRLVAPHARTVVAMDQDHAAISRLYDELHQREQRTILPLVVDLADPSPGLGWQGDERRPLEDRGEPELVLCLALLHHLVIRSHVPLPNVVDWLLRLGHEIVVEFVHRDDVMVQHLLSSKGESYDDYDLDSFESLLAAGGTIVRRETLPGKTRTMFHVRSGYRSK